jgi:CDP-diacylglycerol---glycerol-3-phosphate 3-phosphatidyltransferase
VAQAIEKKKMSFSDFLRVRFKGILDPIGLFLNRLGIMPNTMTMLGLIGTTLGSILLGLGHITWGGLVILIAGPFDALDGTMARLRGEPSKFGAFVDSVSDRYSELIIFGGLTYYFLSTQNWMACGLVYIAAAGSVLVSYVKARAESLGFDAKVGILTRVERYLVLVPGLVFNIPIVALWIIAILANITALQRIIYVKKQTILDHK